MDLPDHELLARFSKNRDERAFELIVTRYLPLVLSVARRKGLAEDLASDVAQQVFVLLAQRPESIRPQEGLVAWLHCVSRTLAIRMWRAEKQRSIRESKAFHAMQNEAPSNSSWEALSPFIDEAISRLAPMDRRIILMRFYERLSLGAVAQATGFSEEAIRKRITRGLERVRSALGKKGITTTAATLATQLPLYSVTPAPAGLAASVCSSALSVGAPTFTTCLTSILITMTTTTKLIVGGAALGCLLIGTIAVIPRSDSSKADAGVNAGKSGLSREGSPSRERSSGATGNRTSSGRPALPDSKPAKPSLPLGEIRESLGKSKLPHASFSNLGAGLAENFDLLGLGDQEQIAVLKAATNAQKQILEAETKLLKPHQSDPASISIDFTAMDAEAEKIKENLKGELANSIPGDVYQTVIDSIDWDNYYFKLPGDKEIKYKLERDAENGDLTLSMIAGSKTVNNTLVGTSNHPTGSPVSLGRFINPVDKTDGTSPYRLMESVLKDYTVTP